MRRFPRPFILLCMCLAFTAPAFAQSQATTGTIEGIVSDATGAVLPGATVTFTNTGTGYTREVVCDADGRYRGLALPLGTYTITVELTGFGKAQRENVPLAVGQTHRIDFTLGVAGVA
ncbi:MAG: carboxypeptidase-like regulatory domain-containing protein, partial [Vicinamibacterales bacterium]